MHIGFKQIAVALLLASLGILAATPPSASSEQAAKPMDDAVPLSSPVGIPMSTLRDVVERYDADRAALYRRHDAVGSAARSRRLREFYATWRQQLRGLKFETLGLEGQLDYLLLDNRVQHEVARLDLQEKRLAEIAPLVPFAAQITELQERRRRMEPVDAKSAAAALAALPASLDQLRRPLESALKKGKGGADLPNPVVTARSIAALDDLRRTLGAWYKFYAGYDPVYTWWAAEPYKRADEGLYAYRRFLREQVLGVKEGEPDPIVGDPVGAEALKADLALEMIPYSPEELIALADRELAWCETELKKAAKDMGFGNDWKAAVEKVKTLHVEPGRQPDLIRDLALEAITFVETRDLVTVPPLAKEIWRIEMMSPERQRVNPFFLGGEVIQVSFPTDAMAHDDKLMSLRGNNIAFARATVQHELIPGHHLQGYMNARYNTHRRTFANPFWTEGWALYWEMLLWDQGFARTPEERVGMLFWRMHRAARIVFSLRFHLGTMTAAEAVDLLVQRVGHERANAEGEVRRSFEGSYPPLYQAAYMLGGLQFRALAAELVGSKKMTARQFHDAILQGGPMPVEMVRARLTSQVLSREHKPGWRFITPNPR